ARSSRRWRPAGFRSSRSQHTLCQATARRHCRLAATTMIQSQSIFLDCSRKCRKRLIVPDPSPGRDHETLGNDMQVAPESGSDQRLKRALLAHVRQDFSAPAGAIVGFAEILLE